MDDVCIVKFQTRPIPKEMPYRPRDPNKLAKHVVNLAVGAIDERPAKRRKKGKNRR